MGWRMLGLLLVSACDGVWGLVKLREPELDSAVPAQSCDMPTRPSLLCADFDEATPVVHEEGVAFPLPISGAGVSAMVREPAVSAPGALWIDSQSASYWIEFDSPSTRATRLEASFDLRIARFDATVAGTALFVLGTKHPAFDHCYVGLELDPQPPRLIMQSHCGSPDINKYTDVLTSLPTTSSWIHVGFLVDLQLGVAQATVEDRVTVLPLQFSTTTAGTTHVRFGVIDANGSLGAELAFDNILVN